MRRKTAANSTANSHRRERKDNPAAPRARPQKQRVEAGLGEPGKGRHEHEAGSHAQASHAVGVRLRKDTHPCLTALTRGGRMACSAPKTWSGVIARMLASGSAVRL